MSTIIILEFGIFATRNIPAGEFLLQYPAKHPITWEEGRKLEEEYQRDKKGCFIFYVDSKPKLW